MAMWVIYQIGSPNKIISKLEAKNEKEALEKLVKRGKIKKYQKNSFTLNGNRANALRVDKISGQKGLFYYK
jgi:hypothetical protein